MTEYDGTQQRPEKTKSRRQFLRLAAAAAIIPLLNIQPRVAVAAPLPALDESDPTAAAFLYKKTQEEAKKVAGYKPGSSCQNCALYTVGNLRLQSVSRKIR
ncbi:MAG: high-potential iron-sulfur protein [Endozoicomonas sp.]